MPHCCKSYVAVQIQLTAETKLLNVALRFICRDVFLPSSCNLASITRQTFFSADSNLRRIGQKFPGPKRIQKLFYKDILVGDLTQQALFFDLCISLTNLNAGLAKLSAF